VNLETLNTVYPRASKRSKEDKEFYTRASGIPALLQDKREPWYGMWKVIRNASVEKIMQIYKTLGCTYDLTNGESDAEPFVNAVVDILRTRGAVESEGCLILDVKRESDVKPMPPIILQKANGGDLYSTSDVSTVYYRYHDFKPDEFIYVADFRQELHFEQVFRAVRIGGFVPSDVKLTHVAYGTMNGKDGKPFKTRSGDTVKLDEVIKLVTEKAGERIRENGKDESGIALAVGLASLKFADLGNTVRKDYVFDIDKFTAFEGKTGAYVLYTIARINSICTAVKKFDAKNVELSPAVREIYMAVVKLADAYTVASETYSLNGIVEATWNLANKFNILHANENIRENAGNLKTAHLVRTVLKFALDTLAIPYVEAM
jgi:arginyl-tRNA synthetase